MTYRENFLSLMRRQGYEFIPVDFSLCPYLEEEYGARLQSFLEAHEIKNNLVTSKSIQFKTYPADCYENYFTPPLKEGAKIDMYGVGHEPGSEAAKHMTYMRNPLVGFETLEELEGYPYPQPIQDEAYLAQIKVENDIYKAEDKIIIAQMQCTVWERTWYMRGMEQLMMDMLCDEELAEFLLDYTTNIAIQEAEFFAKAGVDVIFLGDDVGMQKSVMMSDELYTTWLKPRLKKVIDAAKAINPHVLIFYHSCGFVEPFIPHLIEVGVDVLNPVQPECMSFAEIHEKYGNSISFHGTIGTQTTMPFGTPEDVRNAVFENMKLAQKKGGLLPCPTHLLEPEVPPENIEAYFLACKEFTAE